MSDQPGVRETRLENGLRVISEQVPGSRSFSVGFFVPVGSRHESPALAGASHVLEHLLFKGTKRRTAEAISIAVESVGGDLNAYTTKEHTAFYARVLDVDAELATDVLLDMISNATITASDLDAERAVIIDEIAMHADDPAEVAQELLCSAILGDRDLGPPVIGTAANVVSMTRNQVVRHWRRHYRPDRMVVAAAGHVDHDRLAVQLSNWTADPAGALRPAKANRPPVAAGLVTAVRSTAQTTAVLGFPGRGHHDPDLYALGLLSIILGGGMSSRLFVEVRERRGLTYGIDAGESTFSDSGLWTVEWQCAPSRLAEILSVVRDCLREIVDRGVGPAELSRAQGQLRGQTLLSYESAGMRMSRLGSNALLGDQRTLAELLAAYDAVQPEDLQRVAAQTFSTAPVLAAVGPRVGARRLERLLADWPT